MRHVIRLYFLTYPTPLFEDIRNLALDEAQKIWNEIRTAHTHGRMFLESTTFSTQYNLSMVMKAEWITHNDK